MRDRDRGGEEGRTRVSMVSIMDKSVGAIVAVFNPTKSKLLPAQMVIGNLAYCRSSAMTGAICHSRVAQIADHWKNSELSRSVGAFTSLA